MKIHFLGAARTVTGSNYLIETEKSRFLVDCGLYQGGEDIEKMNKDNFAFDPSKIDFMILTHSHIDHSGRIPLLVKKGFSGRIFCTRPTSALTDIMLKDSAQIQEEEVVFENAKREKAGLDPVEPLYTLEDAENAIQYLYPVDYDTDFSAADGISFTFRNAGHLLGSAYVELTVRDKGVTKTISFSGDLGSGNNRLLNSFSAPGPAQFAVMESTYGSKDHRKIAERSERLVSEITQTYKNGGTVIIPSFAVGRTQEIVYEIRDYFIRQNRLEEFFKLPIYVDSPLAVEATRLYSSYHEFMKKSVSDEFEGSKNPLHAKNVKYVSSPKESNALIFNKDPKIIISASGMCSAGRIRQHLKVHLPEYKTKVIFVGYQGEETLGRALLEGEKNVKIFDEDVAVNAKIVFVEGFSGHADSSSLFKWLRGVASGSGKEDKLKTLFLCHGEEETIEAMKEKVAHDIGSSFDIVIPSLGSSFEI